MGSNAEGKAQVINQFLAQVSARDLWPQVKAEVGRKAVGIRTADDPNLTVWKNGQLPESPHTLTVVTQKKPLFGKLLFTPKEEDRLAVRESDEQSLGIGLKLSDAAFNILTQRITDKIENLQGYGHSFTKNQYTETLMDDHVMGGFFGVKEKRRDWQGERWERENKIKALEKAEALKGKLEALQKEKERIRRG